MVSATLAFNLGHRTLLENFRFALSQKFGQDPDVSAFLKERFATSKPIVVTGVFRRRDGVEISFPKGRRHVLCFWSREAEDLEKLRDRLVATLGHNRSCVRICMTGCRARGAEQVRDAFLEELEKQNLGGVVEVRGTGCQGFCARAPVASASTAPTLTTPATATHSRLSRPRT